jgi:hypothetical protein
VQINCVCDETNNYSPFMVWCMERVNLFLTLKDVKAYNCV